jgi:hypothetical protein
MEPTSAQKQFVVDVKVFCQQTGELTAVSVNEYETLTNEDVSAIVDALTNTANIWKAKRKIDTTSFTRKKRKASKPPTKAKQRHEKYQEFWAALVEKTSENFAQNEGLKPNAIGAVGRDKREAILSQLVTKYTEQQRAVQQQQQHQAAQQQEQAAQGQQAMQATTHTVYQYTFDLKDSTELSQFLCAIAGIETLRNQVILSLPLNSMLPGQFTLSDGSQVITPWERAFDLCERTAFGCTSVDVW